MRIHYSHLPGTAHEATGYQSCMANSKPKADAKATLDLRICLKVAKTRMLQSESNNFFILFLAGNNTVYMMGTFFNPDSGIGG